MLKAPETCLWIVSDGVSENFQERFRALAARAGVALGCPKDTDAEDFWLHRLYLDLVENNSDQLFAASKEGGVILRVCVASATFCARLERKALEQSEPGDRTRETRLSFRAQNSVNSAPNVESKSANEVAGGPFTHSADYRSVTVRSETHKLTAQQAQMVEILHEAYKNRTPDVSIALILERLEKKGGKNSSRWQDTFRSNPTARKALITAGARRGTLRLNL